MSQGQCPKCSSENIYEDGNLWICPECSHEWSSLDPQEKTSPEKSKQESTEPRFKDAHGSPLVDGDSVTVLKELKIKGSSSVVKVGTKVKNIRLVDGPDGHDISCKIDGIGAIHLKSQYVRKV